MRLLNSPDFVYVNLSMDEEISDKHKLRSARTTFFNNLLKRTNSKVQAVRYEDTPSAHPVSIGIPPGITPTNKRYKILGSKSDGSDDMAPSAASKVPLLIRFYDPDIKAEDASGRTLHDILAWNDIRLERSHNYIQMLFPLPEGSMFNMEAPLITREVMEAFLERSELRGQLRKAFERIIDFYGFMIEQKDGDADDADAAMAKPKEKDGEAEGKSGAEELKVEHSQTENMNNAEESKKEDVQATNSEDHQTPDQPRPAQGDGMASSEPEIDPNGSNHLVHSTLKAPEDTTVSPNNPDQANTHGSVSAASQTQQHDKSLLSPAVRLVRAPHWRQAFRNWAIRFDHNHLRMTRILRSLRVLGLREECNAFYEALREVFNDEHIYINERSMAFWHKAVKNPLHIAPDGERVGWLRRWIEEQKMAMKAAAEDAKAGEQGGEKPTEGCET